MPFIAIQLRALIFADITVEILEPLPKSKPVRNNNKTKRTYTRNNNNNGSGDYYACYGGPVAR